MNAAEITALCTGIPAILGAITALIIAIKSGRTAVIAQNMVIGHVTRPGVHNRPDPLAAPDRGINHDAG